MARSIDCCREWFAMDLKSLREVETQFMDVTEAESLAGVCLDGIGRLFLLVSGAKPSLAKSRPSDNGCLAYARLSKCITALRSDAKNSRVCVRCYRARFHCSMLQFVFHTESTGPWIDSSSARVLDPCTDSFIVEPRRSGDRSLLSCRILGFLDTQNIRLLDFVIFETLA